MLHLALKMRPAALEDFKQAVALKPDFIEARNNLGALLNETQDYGAAVQQLQEAVLISPDFVAARLNLGNAYRGQGQYAKASEEYRHVLRLKPDLVDAYYNLAILHLDTELPQTDAIERLKTAITYFDQYRTHGGKDARIDAYLKDANKGIEKEQRRRDRERKEQLKKSNQAAVSSPVDSKPAVDPAAPTKPPSAKIDAASRSRPPR
jgi:tetratricopeptide (TPR) repeat protein